MNKIDFIETNAVANANLHIASADALAKEAHQTLLLLLAGAGGGFAYGVSFVEKGMFWAASGFVAASGYLFVLAAALVWTCLRIRPLWPPANEPENLMREDQEEWSLERLRFAEMRTRQDSIDANRRRNDAVGYWLTMVRVAATATPLIFIAAAWVSGR